MANTERLREQLAEEEAWLRRLCECFRTCDDLRVSMRRDPKEFPEALLLADAAAKMLWRRVCQQRDRCTAIKRQLEGDVGGGK